MKKLLIITLALIITSCGVNTSSNINIDTDDIKYVKDNRSGLCFGIVASRKSFNSETSGLGVTCVPCENVKSLIK